MLKEAPAESRGLAASSGWMNNELLPKVLKHLLKFMSVSKANPGLLLLDNHRSHFGLEVIDSAEDNGLSILTFPPQCSHRLQPLYVSIFGSSLCCYNEFADNWMTS